MKSDNKKDQFVITGIIENRVEQSFKIPALRVELPIDLKRSIKYVDAKGGEQEIMIKAKGGAMLFEPVFVFQDGEFKLDERYMPFRKL